MPDFPIRASDGLKFQVKSLVKKFYQKWDESQKKFIKSDVWMTGLQPRYIFDLVDGKQIDLSRDQWQQALVASFDEKKHWKDCVFIIKTNGKTGLETRYFVNVCKDVGREEPKEEINPADWQ